MKTKKILAIMISCLLLIGVAVGITASAAEEPAVGISSINLSYEGAIRIVYTLDSENVKAGQSLKMLFSYDENVTAENGALNVDAYDYVASTNGSITVGGASYPAVYSDGFAPADMTKKVYAIPVVTEGANIVAVGAKVGFSIQEYCLTRFGGSYTPEQYLLYLSALDFGGSVQNAQKITEGTDPVGGYADAYYVLKVMNGDGTVTTYSYKEPTSASLTAPKTFGGKLFDSFVDEKGNVYTDADFNKLVVDVDKIGYTYVKMVYGDIDAASATLPAGNSATIPNPDNVTVNGGSEFFIEGDVSLSEGASATLAFNPDVLAVTLAENAGMVTVSDGVSSFTMANGATLKVEYTVLSTKNLTGVVFYYVNGEYVAKSDVTSTQNTSFTGVTAAVSAGEATFDAVTVGATSSIMTVANKVGNTTATFEYDENGKYVVVSKLGENTDGGSVYFTYGGTKKQHAVFETEMKLTGGLYNSNWRNLLTINLQSSPGSGNLIIPQVTIQQNSFKIKGTGITTTTTTLDTPIADDGWFNFKIDIVSAVSENKVITSPGVLTIYINDQIVYQGEFDSTNKLGNVQFQYENSTGVASMQFRNDKFYTIED